MLHFPYIAIQRTETESFIHRCVKRSSRDVTQQIASDRCIFLLSVLKHVPKAKTHRVCVTQSERKSTVYCTMSGQRSYEPIVKSRMDRRRVVLTRLMRVTSHYTRPERAGCLTRPPHDRAPSPLHSPGYFCQFGYQRRFPFRKMF